MRPGMGVGEKGNQNRAKTTNLPPLLVLEVIFSFLRLFGLVSIFSFFLRYGSIHPFFSLRASADLIRTACSQCWTLQWRSCGLARVTFWAFKVSSPCSVQQSNLSCAHPREIRNSRKDHQRIPGGSHGG